ncbi:sporulation integral membrane protein YlbJ [Clostridium thermarum]|uniref:sporulation integral membrane protein YlbJ n=1 Tax=Clostridium thermarum TaxID=1716543 RepID=UPI00111E2CD7|nr:sporulation integral membrane protein YlbJ [Clostridium thermarum]
MLQTLLLLILSLSLLFLINSTIRWKSINIIIVFLCTCVIIYFITFPKQCINSTLFGAKIFFTALFPSLFPFLIVCNLLIRYDGIEIYSKLFGRILCKPLRLSVQCSIALIISALCGYPLGAKYTCDLYEKSLISKDECQRLLNIASNTGPIFIVGSVATVMLGNTQLGYIMLFSNYIACIIISFLIKPVSTYVNISGKNNFSTYLPSKRNFGSELKESINNALKTVISVGGYVVLFAVLIDILSYNKYFDLALLYITKNTNTKDILKSALLGIIELTKGCQLISTLNISLYYKSIIISFLSCFSGLSIISQVYSFTYKFPELSMKKYIKRKAVQGLISSIVTALLLLPFEKISTSTFTAINVNSSFNWVYIILFVLLLIPLCIHSLKKLFHIS